MMQLIWPSDKAKYFSSEGLTGILSECPSGKSVCVQSEVSGAVENILITGRYRAASITNARMRPSMTPAPNRSAKASAVLCVASSSLDGSRATISFLSGVP